MNKETLPLSDLAQSLKPGLYQHFKGGKYKVLGVGRMSEDHEREMVVYESVESGYVWIRPLEMFVEMIERNGYKGPRFIYIG